MNLLRSAGKSITAIRENNMTQPRPRSDQIWCTPFVLGSQYKWQNSERQKKLTTLISKSKMAVPHISITNYYSKSCNDTVCFSLRPTFIYKHVATMFVYTKYCIMHCYPMVFPTMANLAKTCIANLHANLHTRYLFYDFLY